MTPCSYEPVSPDSKIATPISDSTQMVPLYTPGPDVTGLALQREKVEATTSSTNDMVPPYTLYTQEHIIMSKDSNVPATVPGGAGVKTNDQIECDQQIALEIQMDFNNKLLECECDYLKIPINFMYKGINKEAQ